jgi:DNA polymerase-3 subunit beta
MKKVTFAIAELKKVLDRLETINSNVSALSVLMNLKVEVTPTSTAFQTSNLEVTMTDNLDCQSMDNFSMLIDKKGLREIVKDLPDGAIDIEYNEAGNTIRLITPAGKFSLGTDEVKEFPVFKENEPTTTIAITPAVISKLAIANQFVSADKLRPAMTGVYFHFINDTLRLIATDAHCLYRSEELAALGIKDLGLIIGSEAVNTLTKSMYGTDTIMEITAPENASGYSHAIFKYGKTTLAIRLIDAKFPDYAAVIPQSENLFCVVAAELRKKIKLAMHTANTTTNHISFGLGNKALTIASADKDFSKSSDIEPIEIENQTCPDFDFAFNGKMLDKILAHFPNNLAIVTEGQASRAFLFQHRDIENNNNDLFLLMPLIGA